MQGVEAEVCEVGDLAGDGGVPVCIYMFSHQIGRGES